MNHEIFQEPVSLTPKEGQPLGTIGAGLTIQPQVLYSGERGPERVDHGVKFIMADEGREGLLPKPTEVNAQSHLEKPPSVGSPARQKPEIKPVSEMSGSTLQEEYRRLVGEIASEKEPRLSEKKAQELQPRLVEIMDKLKNQGVDVAKLSQTTRAELPGQEKRGPGTPAGGADWVNLGDTAPEELKKWENYINSTDPDRFYDPDFLDREDARLVEFMFREHNPIHEDQVNAAREALRTPGVVREVARRQHERLAQRFGEERGHYGQHQLSPDEKKQIRMGGEEADRLFDRMFIRVDNRPRDDFRDAFGMAGEFEFTDFMNTLGDAWEKAENAGEYLKLSKLITKYSQEKNIREIIHQANYALSANVNTENFTGFLQKFSSDMADSIYRTEGVTVAAHIYEQAMRKVMDENGGYLPVAEAGASFSAEKITGREGRVEQLARDYFKVAIKAGLVRDKNDISYGEKIKTLTEDKNFQEAIEKKIGRKPSSEDLSDEALEQVFPEWKRVRSLSLARGMGIVNMTTIEILASSKLPEKESIASLYGQDIIKDVAPYRHLLGKFGVGIERLALLGFLTKHKGRFWTQKELLQFKDEIVKTGHAGRIVNGDLLGEDELGERAINILNPLETGSGYSHSTWRVNAATDNPNFEGDRKEWIGSGVRLEKLRGAFRKEKLEVIKRKLPEGERQVKKEIVGILEKIAEIQPLKLYRQMIQLGYGREHDQILEEIFGMNAGEMSHVRMQMKKGSLLPGPEKILEKIDLAEQDLSLVQEKMAQDGLRRGIKFKDAKLDFSILTKEGGRRENAEALAKKINEKFQGKLGDLAEKIGSDEWPFVLGTEDIPHDKYQYVETGPTGFARGARDFAAAAKAADGIRAITTKMDSYARQEDIIKDFRALVYDNIKGYDETKARRYIMVLAEGVAKYYGKDWMFRLPFGIGTGLGWLGARGALPYRGSEGNWKFGLRSSYAKTVYGDAAMAWDETNKWSFVNALWAEGMLSYEQVKELRKKIGATQINVWYDRARTLGPLALWLLISEFFKVAGKGLEKDLER